MIWIKGIFRLFLFSLLLGILACFITSNPQLVAVSLFPLPFDIMLPVYALGLFTLALGLFLGAGAVYIGSAIAGWRHARKEAHTKKKMSLMEQEIQSLRMEKQMREHYAAEHNPHGQLITLP